MISGSTWRFDTIFPNVSRRYEKRRKLTKIIRRLKAKEANLEHKLKQRNHTLLEQKKEVLHNHVTTSIHKEKIKEQHRCITRLYNTCMQLQNDISDLSELNKSRLHKILLFRNLLDLLTIYMSKKVQQIETVTVDKNNLANDIQTLKDENSCLYRALEKERTKLLNYRQKYGKEIETKEDVNSESQEFLKSKHLFFDVDTQKQGFIISREKSLYFCANSPTPIEKNNIQNSSVTFSTTSPLPANISYIKNDTGFIRKNRKKADNNLLRRKRSKSFEFPKLNDLFGIMPKKIHVKFLRNNAQNGQFSNKSFSEHSQLNELLDTVSDYSASIPKADILIKASKIVKEVDEEKFNNTSCLKEEKEPILVDHLRNCNASTPSRIEAKAAICINCSDQEKQGNKIVSFFEDCIENGTHLKRRKESIPDFDKNEICESCTFYAREVTDRKTLVKHTGSISDHVNLQGSTSLLGNASCLCLNYEGTSFCSLITEPTFCNLSVDFSPGGIEILVHRYPAECYKLNRDLDVDYPSELYNVSRMSAIPDKNEDTFFLPVTVDHNTTCFDIEEGVINLWDSDDTAQDLLQKDVHRCTAEELITYIHKLRLAYKDVHTNNLFLQSQLGRRNERRKWIHGTVLIPIAVFSVLIGTLLPILWW